MTFNILSSVGTLPHQIGYALFAWLLVAVPLFAVLMSVFSAVDWISKKMGERFPGTRVLKILGWSIVLTLAPKRPNAETASYDSRSPGRPYWDLEPAHVHGQVH